MSKHSKNRKLAGLRKVSGGGISVYGNVDAARDVAVTDNSSQNDINNSQRTDIANTTTTKTTIKAGLFNF